MITPTNGARSGHKRGVMKMCSSMSVAAALGAAIVVLAPAAAEARWGVPYLPRPPIVRRMPPDQSWMQDIPERPGSRVKNKVAVFVFRGDDVYEPVRAAVVRSLRRRGLNVTASLKPVDSAEQFREMSYTLNLAAYVEGVMSGEGARQRARIQLRSGVSGQPIAAATFAGPTPKIIADVNRTLWTRLGPSVSRACSSAARPRRRERDPLHIDAGTPLDSRPIAAGL
jgi:hypothetical protein